MIHQAVSEIWVFRMRSTILEHPVFMIKYISIFRLVLGRLLVAKNKNLTGFSTGLTGRSKNLDPTGNPTGRSTRPVPVDPTGFHLWAEALLLHLSSDKRQRRCFFCQIAAAALLFK